MNSEFNPAFTPNQGYINIPLISGIRVGVDGDISLKNYLYPNNGELVTFLHPSITSDEFKYNLTKSNQTLEQNISFSILGAGWYTAKGSFWSANINMYQNFNAGIPTDLFRLAKAGMTDENNVFNMKDLHTTAEAYIETRVGHSREMFIPGLRLGINIKALVGLGRAEAYYDNLSVTLNQNQWNIAADGRATVYQSGIEFGNKNNNIDLNNVSTGSFKPSGFGLGIDLGATYNNLYPGLKLAFAINDIGFMNWNPSTHGIAKSNFSFTGFEDIDAENSTDEQWEAIEDNLKKVFELENRPTSEANNVKSLRTNIRLSGEYNILEGRSSQKLYGGLAYYGRYIGVYSYNEAMLSIRYSPTHWFGLSANYIQPFNRKPSMGFAMTLSPKGINLFIAANIGSFSYTTQYVPIEKASANLNFGISIPLTRYRKENF
ncbi:MAG: DUF5723 family protein [Phocaeicola sp.]